METQEQIKRYKYSTAKTFGRLSIGILTVSMIADPQRPVVLLIVIGLVSALIGIYLAIWPNLKREWFLRKVATREVMLILEACGWFIILSLFGLRLIQEANTTGAV